MQVTVRPGGKMFILLSITFLTIVSLLATQVQPVARAAVNLVVYEDALATGWEDWSWQTTRNLDNAAPVHTGTKSIAVQPDAAWSGFSLRTPNVINTSGYTAIEFWIYGAGGGTQLAFATQSSDEAGTSSAVAVNAPANTWSKVQVTLAALGNPTQIARLNWQETTGAAQPTYYLDEITLIGTDAGEASFPDPTADRQIDFPKSLAGVAIAPSGRLYVASWRESKIYSWADAKSVANPATSADLIFGVAMDPENPGGGAGCGAVTAKSFCGPEGLVVDSNGNLYVAATYENRVQVFFNPATDATPDEADLSITGLSGPRGLALDATGNLYVVNEFESGPIKKGIHIFQQPLTTDTVADFVIVDGIVFPLGVAVDAAGNVYVADAGAHNVKRYNTPLTTDLLLDQTYSDFADPHDLALDAAGNLYISDVTDFSHTPPNPPDSNNSRVAVIADPLNSTTVAHEFPNLAYPLGLTFDDTGSLYVAHCVGPYKCDGVGKLLVFNAPVAAPTPTDTPTGADIQLQVDVAANRHPISDLIYGMNWGSETFANDADISVRRWGGNRATRYNWQTDMGNSAFDWYFENVRESNATNLPNDSAANRFIGQDRRTGAASYITVPMAGYVSNDTEADCGFSTNQYNYTPTQFPDGRPANDAAGRPHCGNGVTQFRNNNEFEPVFFQGNDPLDTSIPISESFVGAWVQHLTGQFGAANAGGVRYYGLDNEPDLWHISHADIHPAPHSYDELGRLGIAYAGVIKGVDATAQVLGPEFGGWWAYFTSAQDTVAGNANDRQAHGNLELTAWYLQQFAQYEQQNGVRLLDYLSLHFYPEAANVKLGPAGDDATQALRLRSTRALWDTTYADESWMAQTDNGPYVRLIPRMKEWVNTYYPGTKLAISEYNWGGLEHINGALTQADILGVFGREGVDMALIWDPPAANQPGAFAFRIYRDYDGQGSQFGNVGVGATSSDQAQLSVYAAQRSSDNSLTLIVINKTGAAIDANLAVSNFELPTLAEIYRYSETNLAAIVREPDQAVSGTGFTASYPPNSITLVRMAAALTPGATPTPVAPTPVAPTATPIPGTTPSTTPDASDQQIFLPVVAK